MLGQKTFALALMLTTFAAGCSQEAADESVTVEETTSNASDAIKGGVRADAYPESVIVNLRISGNPAGECSGSVISPYVVLTAGHCIRGYSEWSVRAPYAGNQTINVTGRAVFDYLTNGFDSQHHDVGVLFLSTPIRLAQYPAISKYTLPANTNVVSIGNVLNGTPSTTDLFVGASVPVVPSGYPYLYESTRRVIERGDSGGPVEIPGTTPHAIVAVNAAGDSTWDYFARIDQVYDWVQDQIASHGGQGGGAFDPRPPTMPAAPTLCGQLRPGEGLTVNRTVSSCDGRFTLILQGDGNLVLYWNGHGALWSSSTYGKPVSHVFLQGDGNVVLYNRWKPTALVHTHLEPTGGGILRSE